MKSQLNLTALVPWISLGGRHAQNKEPNLKSPTKPPIATSRSSVRIKTMFGLRFDLASAPLIRQLHKVTQMRKEFNNCRGNETVEHILIIYWYTMTIPCLRSRQLSVDGLITPLCGKAAADVGLFLFNRHTSLLPDHVTLNCGRPCQVT